MRIGTVIGGTLLVSVSIGSLSGDASANPVPPYREGQQSLNCAYAAVGWADEDTYNPADEDLVQAELETLGDALLAARVCPAGQKCEPSDPARSEYVAVDFTVSEIDDVTGWIQLSLGNCSTNLGLTLKKLRGKTTTVNPEP